METVMLHSSTDQSLSPYRSMRNPKRNSTRPMISRSSKNSAPLPSTLSSNFGGGIFHAPPFSLSYSTYTPSLSILNHYQPQKQPPLLPLPISKSDNNSRNRGLSCPPINRKINRTRAQSLTPKKSKPSIVSPKKGDDINRDLKSMSSSSSECLIITSTDRLGPEPKDFLKDVSRVSSSGNNGDLEKFSGSMSSILSPPPSSLPLPTFSLRPKLSCKAEVGGIDAGATDKLRRILRLP
ncbi:uncharacterized protein LOC132276658 [Cornus florida]|uniref:uncharacterized protein LOC132276658 n=1 Tax=Cornus florida TaxID=4283 RepID=UPI00289CCA03|nr:uncharacterized protein LOC132276658 [Cornus florida]